MCYALVAYYSTHRTYNKSDWTLSAAIDFGWSQNKKEKKNKNTVVLYNLHFYAFLGKVKSEGKHTLDFLLYSLSIKLKALICRQNLIYKA